MAAWRCIAVMLVAVVLGSCGASPGASPSSSVTASAASPSGPAPAGGSPSSAGPTVNVTESEYKISVDPVEGTAGPVAFAVKNAGTVPHEFDIYQASQPLDALPIGVDNKVDETKVRSVETSDSISPGDTETITATLDPGTYYIVCNMPGHYQSGMRLTYTVK